MLTFEGKQSCCMNKVFENAHAALHDVANGATIIDTNDNATSLGQMIEWMYGIDDEKLLIDAKSVQEVTAMGSKEVYGEVVTLSDLANIAEKV